MTKKSRFRATRVKNTDMLQTFREDNADVFYGRIVVPEYIKDEDWSMYIITIEADSWLFNSQDLWHKAFTSVRNSDDGFAYLVTFAIDHLEHIEVVTNFVDKYYTAHGLVCEFKIYHGGVVKIMVTRRNLIKGKFDVEFGELVSDKIDGLRYLQ